MAPRGASRQAAITAASELMRRQGYAATGLEEVLATSGAPKGSFYFHFPEGKEQLAAEALAHGGREVRDFVDHVVADAPTPGAAILTIAAAEARQLARSDYELGCPIATVTLEMASRSAPVRHAARAAFDSWIEPLASRLQSHGHDAGRATELARWAIAALEGALVLARAAQDVSIITTSAEITAATLDAGLPDVERGERS